MNTMLVIMVMLGPTKYEPSWTPEFVVKYNTEEQCTKKTYDYTAMPHNKRKGICVPPTTVMPDDVKEIKLD